MKLLPILHCISCHCRVQRLQYNSTLIYEGLYQHMLHVWCMTYAPSACCVCDAWHMHGWCVTITYNFPAPRAPYPEQLLSVQAAQQFPSLSWALSTLYHTYTSLLIIPYYLLNQTPCRLLAMYHQASLAGPHQDNFNYWYLVTEWTMNRTTGDKFSPEAWPTKLD